MYIYVCVSWVSSDHKEAQPCKTSSECVLVLCSCDSNGMHAPPRARSGQNQVAANKGHPAPARPSFLEHVVGGEAQVGVRMSGYASD